MRSSSRRRLTRRSSCCRRRSRFSDGAAVRRCGGAMVRSYACTLARLHALRRCAAALPPWQLVRPPPGEKARQLQGSDSRGCVHVHMYACMYVCTHLRLQHLRVPLQIVREIPLLTVCAHISRLSPRTHFCMQRRKKLCETL